MHIMLSIMRKNFLVSSMTYFPAGIIFYFSMIIMPRNLNPEVPNNEKYKILYKTTTYDKTSISDYS